MTAAADNKARERKTGDSRRTMLPFTDTRKLAEKGGARIITHADSVYICDSEGNRILDGMAALAKT